MGTMMLGGCAGESSGNTATSDQQIATGESIWDIKELDAPSQTIDADVCIIGGGGCGLATAVQAIDEGLRPVILEQRDTCGGSFVDTEGMSAYGTRFTEGVTFDGAYFSGMEYNARNAIATCLNYHHWIPDHKLYERFFGQTAETVEWLEDHGVGFEAAISIGVGPRVWHLYDKGDLPIELGPGAYFAQCLTEEATRLGADIRLGVTARKVLVEDGKVTGCLAETADGTVIQVNAPAAMIATGGFSNSPEFMAELSNTRNENTIALGVDCHYGDGLKIGKDAGAAFAEGLSTVMWCGPLTVGVAPYNWTTDAYSATVQPTLWLNQNGERFCSEDLWIDDFAAAGMCMRNQKRTFVLFTEANMQDWEQNGPWGQVFSFGIPGVPMGKAREILTAASGCHIGDDLAALCTKVGLDPNAVAETVSTYNEMCRTAADLDKNDTSADTNFGKRACYMNPVEEGPYWLCEVADGYFCTCGGLAVNENAQVLNEQGEPIVGLYAGGNDAGGLYGDSYDVKYSPGSQAAWAVNAGRLAMKHASTWIGK